MRVFEIAVKFEQDGKWSKREVDTEGYLIQKYDEYNIIEGYVKVLYPTRYDSVRFIKGLLCESGSGVTSLVFMQMCNEFTMSPLCYVFPDVEKQTGYWSDFNMNFGFFPVQPHLACSQGHAKIWFKEVTGKNLVEIAKETSAIFEENARDAIFWNECLMKDVRSLTDFLDSGIILQMKLHCGRW